MFEIGALAEDTVKACSRYLDREKPGVSVAAEAIGWLLVVNEPLA
jgi:hypothetical protein